ncbi:MAG: response regulator [Methylovirgula sp.]|uniref:response regulator transcription factor n=1 Tax=Methylovirgula sp. TaxID=1978224 RepID=UPI0030764FA5
MLQRSNLVAAEDRGRYVPGMAQPGLVHIIDDDDGVRAALASLIRSVGNDARLYSSAAEFLTSALPPVPSCLLLDVRLPEINGLDFQDSLRRRGIFLPVILMTGYGDIQMSVRGMKAGAVDFLTKPVRHQDLLDAISTALARDRDWQRDNAEVSAIRDRHSLLTRRELEVFTLVTAGKMNKQVAGDLNLSEITVKIHRGSVMRKMGARTLADLVKMAELLRMAGSTTNDHH